MLSYVICPAPQYRKCRELSEWYYLSIFSNLMISFLHSLITIKHLSIPAGFSTILSSPGYKVSLILLIYSKSACVLFEKQRLIFVFRYVINSTRSLLFKAFILQTISSTARGAEYLSMMDFIYRSHTLFAFSPMELAIIPCSLARCKNL